MREILSDCVTNRERKGDKSLVLCSSSVFNSNDMNYSCIGVFLVEYVQVNGLEREMKSRSRAFVSV